ncbi:MFS transporter [Microbacterium stercoris]|uniref:MFS transporter n=1 Tax=Microbacterium stercoris TaxID=2820289 RepID=A0A939QM47_9MICO|nr:MFS transporter [Microbacterium stercoris]MBO3664760.1 MFS transporter [Microbacterium stercoris]
MTRAGTAAAGRALPWLVVSGVLVAALSLRGPILSVTPVLRDIARDYELDGATASLLTTFPVLMFAAITPLAAIAIRRAGAELALLACLIGVAVGTLIRAVPGFGWMITGMIVIGASITIGNVVIPVIIGRDVPAPRVATVTAAYTAALNGGSLLTTLTTAGIAEATGWSVALLLWGVLTLLGIGLWALHLWRDRIPGVRWDERASGGVVRSEAVMLTGPVPVMGRRGDVVRNPTVWLLVAAFGCQSAGYYGMSTWLPAMLGDMTGSGPAGAGALASIFQGVAIVGAFIVPALARWLPLAVPAGVVAACWIALSTGMLLAPELFPLWVSLGGVAHAGGFVVIFTVMVGIARSDAEAAAMSALVQGAAYLVGAASGPVLGAVHDATGAWTAPLTITLSLALGFTICLMTAVARVRR